MINNSNSEGRRILSCPGRVRGLAAASYARTAMMGGTRSDSCAEKSADQGNGKPTHRHERNSPLIGRFSCNTCGAVFDTFSRGTP